MAFLGGMLIGVAVWVFLLTEPGLRMFVTIPSLILLTVAGVGLIVIAPTSILLKIGLSFIGAGIVFGAVGWWFNMNTPMQQPMPVIGGVVVAVGLVLILLSL